MKSSRNRKLAALLALSWVAALPATRAPLFLLALALGHHGEGHSYSLSLSEDASHFDLVLSHADSPGHESDDPHADSPSCSEGDHVVHLCDDPALRDAGRRHELGDAPILGHSLLVSFAPVQPRTWSSRSVPQLRAADLLRSVVLRC